MRNDRVYVSSLYELRLLRSKNSQETALLRRKVQNDCCLIKEHLSLFGLVQRKLNGMLSEFSFWDFLKNKA